MSQSGIPVVEQIGQGGAAIGQMVGSLLFGDLAGPTSPTPSPDIATPTDGETADAIRKAQQAQARKTGRGVAANMFFGTSGSTTSNATDGWAWGGSSSGGSLSRATLLGG